MENTTQRVAKSASLWYRAAKMVAVAPAGMPVMRTLTPRGTCSYPRIFLRTKAAAGRASRRKSAKRTVSLLTMVESFTSARMVPTINMVMAELQFPIYRAVSVTTEGRDK